ncbi:hypothetical protein SYN63AY4M2_04795 [Synechococcus sp. 63AY4M2]|nr:hypothetical protein SYN63AY4M2_04795 [Synechococcus sp. 63AY4M2]
MFRDKETAPEVVAKGFFWNFKRDEALFPLVSEA